MKTTAKFQNVIIVIHIFFPKYFNNTANFILLHSAKSKIFLLKKENVNKNIKEYKGNKCTRYKICKRENDDRLSDNLLMASVFNTGENENSKKSPNAKITNLSPCSFLTEYSANGNEIKIITIPIAKEKPSI
jgi:hypothetical protein